MRTLLLPLGTILAFVFLLPSSALTKKDGAEAAKTGAPGNGTCAESGCHSDNDPDTGSGSITIVPPTSITPGDTVEYVITVAQTGAQIFGFQATVRRLSDNRVTGKFVLSQGQKFSDAIGDYITHANAVVTNDSNEWTVRWVAPDQAEGEIIMYAAGVAGNDNNNRSGDRVYTTSATRAMQVSIEKNLAESGFALEEAYPNPFTSQTSVPFVLDSPSAVTITLYDILGRAVQSESLGVLPAGNHVHTIERAALSSGAYIYELSTPRAKQSKMLTLTD